MKEIKNFAQNFAQNVGLSPLKYKQIESTKIQKAGSSCKVQLEEYNLTSSFSAHDGMLTSARNCLSAPVTAYRRP